MNPNSLCDTCPVVCRTKDSIANFEGTKTDIMTFAGSTAIDEFAGAHVDNVPGVQLVEPRGDKAASVRRGIADALDDLDRHIEVNQRFLGDLAVGCNGSFEPLLVNDGVTYIFRVCASPQAPEGNTLESIFIERERNSN